MTESSKKKRQLSQASKKAAKLRLDQVEYTLIVCMDRKSAKCCSARSMNECWRSLKQHCRDWRRGGKAPVLKIKSACIGICKGGPIIGVLPDGVWYGGCTPGVIERIFDEHLSSGKIVDDHVIAQSTSGGS